VMPGVSVPLYHHKKVGCSSATGRGQSRLCPSPPWLQLLVVLVHDAVLTVLCENFHYFIHATLKVVGFSCEVCLVLALVHEMHVVQDLLSSDLWYHDPSQATCALSVSHK
jgi:hypothetical protein